MMLELILILLISIQITTLYAVYVVYVILKNNAKRDSNISLTIHSIDVNMYRALHNYIENMHGTVRVLRLPEFIEDDNLEIEVLKYLIKSHPKKEGDIVYVYERLLEDGRYLLAKVE